MDKYGQTIKMGDSSWGVHNCDTPEKATNSCIRYATKDGWTNPKWWQFWRWGDTRFTQAEIDEAMKE